MSTEVNQPPAIRPLLKRWWFWLLVVSPLVVIGIVVALQPHPRHGFLTRENIHKVMQTCSTKEEFEQVLGQPNSAPWRSSGGVTVMVGPPAKYESWDDTVLDEDGIVYERGITIAFDPITGRVRGKGLYASPQPTLWERLQRWIRQRLS